MRFVLLVAAVFVAVNGKSIFRTRGLDRSDDWFVPLRAIATKVITETFGLQEIKDKVEAVVDACMQKDDIKACLKQEVDTISDALGQDVPQAERDDAKGKVGFLSDFLGAVYKNCNDAPEDKIGKCAMETGKGFCSQAGDKQKDCMDGVFRILGAAKKLKEEASQGEKRGLDRDDEWFDGLSALGTEVITEHFGLEAVRDKVKASVEKCMEEDDTTQCLQGEVDTVSDALGQDVPQADRDDAKEKVGFLSRFLGAVHKNCRDLPEDKIGECAVKTGYQFCSRAGDKQEECSKRVYYILAKAKELHDEASQGEKRGLDRDDVWFDGLSALGTEIITETFDLEAVRDKVKATVEKCMEEDDTTQCLKNEVDTVSDALGQDVPQADRDEAKEKVGFLSNFLGAVHKNCKDVPEDKIGDCAFQTGKGFCSQAGDRQQECMKGVFYILGKAKQMHEESNNGKKRGLDRDDELFDEIRDFASAVIVDHFNLQGVKDMVKNAVEKCMQEDDTTQCLKNEVDSVSDALGKDVPQSARDDAKEKVGFLSDFLGAVYTNCHDAPEDKAEECAVNTGKEFCSNAGDRQRDCMRGVKHVLDKAREYSSDK